MESFLGNALAVTVASHYINADHVVSRHYTPRIASYKRTAANRVSSFRNLAGRFELHLFRIHRVLVHLRSFDALWFAR